MPKGYWVANVNVDDPERYEDYKAANKEPFERYGARFVVRGGQKTVMEGASNDRVVVIEFPSYADAVACYNDPAYQAAVAIRAEISQGSLVIVEGYDA